MKRIRLDPSAYQQGNCFFLSMTTAGRALHFTNAGTVRLCLDALSEAARQYQASVFAYCFMPDHAHLLVATPSGVDLVQFVRHFKQLSAHRFRRDAAQTPLWQSRFYDHALRGDEELMDVAHYILENPVRAGLVQSPAQHPYSGSLVWEETGELVSARV